MNWPRTEHWHFVDANDHVWLPATTRTMKPRCWNLPATANSSSKIGEGASHEGSNSTRYLGRPALAIVDESTHELYVADGYGNKRIVVFDARTGNTNATGVRTGRRRHRRSRQVPISARPRAQQFALRCTVCGSRARFGLRLRPGQRPLPSFRKDGTFVTEYVWSRTRAS